MIVLALFVLGAFLVLACGRSQGDDSRDPGRGLDALLFALCLASTLHAAHKRKQDEEF